MKLADLNPFIPKDPDDRDLFIKTFTTELRVYRRKPVFFICLPVMLVCSLLLISWVGTAEKLLIAAMICCMALVHDTITSHFTRRLIEARKPAETTDPSAAPILD